MDTNGDARVVVMDIKNEKIKDLLLHPQNPRQGDIGAIATSIQENGWYGTVVAQKSTNYVLAGNHRLQAAQQLGIKEVPVYWVDVDDKTATKIMLADNKTNDLALYDDDILATLLTELASTDDLLGTGFDGDDLDLLLQEEVDWESLVNQYPADDSNLWKSVSFKLPIELWQQWNMEWNKLDGTSDDDKVRAILELIS